MCFREVWTSLRSSNVGRFRSPLGSCRLLLIAGFLLGLSAFAQQEPCGFYETDQQPGYGPADMFAVAAQWGAVGTYPTVPDYNGDGIVNLLDMAQQASCVDDLAPGLVGSYYGFATGEPGQTLTFPNFGALAFNPSTIQTADQLFDLVGWDGFLDSNMEDFFGLVYEGYLFVPEDATYTFQVSGRDGMRVFLDGTSVMDYDGWPWTDNYTHSLSYGLHPFKIEFYAASDGTISLGWSSTGSIIGASNVTITPDYLFHAEKVVPENTTTELKVVFNPTTGSRVTSASPLVKAYVLGPNTQVTLDINGEKLLYDGHMEENLSLSAGLNRIPYTATDGEGRTVTGIYNLFYDSGASANSGLSCNIYATEWYRGIVPPTDDLDPYRWFASSGTQMQVDGNNNLYMEGKLVPPWSIVELRGMIQIDTAGTYTFRIDDGQGALFIDGIEMAGISNDFSAQWDNQETIYLTAGKHHYHLRTGAAWNSPRMRVFWTVPGASEALIPNSKFSYATSEKILPPTFTSSTATGGRSATNLVAEYVFRSANPFGDSSGNGYDLPHDTRAISRSPGGLTLQTAAGMGSLQAGIQLAERIRNDGPLSLEVDMVCDDVLDWHERNLISLSEPYQSLFSIYTQYDDIFMAIYDDTGTAQTIQANNLLVRGNRYHVVGTFSGTVMKLYVNGSLMATQNYNPTTANWPALVDLDIGQSWFRREAPSTWGYQMKGTVLAAAAYNSEISAATVSANRSATLTLNPTPAAYTHPAAPTFPTPGTNQADLDEAFHILNRLSFGPSPSSINEVLSQGVNNYIAAQLDPSSIDDSQMEAELNSGYFLPTQYTRDLQGWLTYRMTRSNRQLLEVLTWFWENHFNTNAEKTDDLIQELAENQRFRDLALGDFESLLFASAMHYPMTVYLDSDSNVVGAPNENYAREILELHSYGVNNGYTQEDIVEVARCFTGWTVRNGDFYFNPGLHDYGAKAPLGMTIAAGGGMGDGIEVIKHIAASPNTASFIAWKLCQVFVDDDPPSDVVSAVATTFSSSQGDILQSLQTLFAHARFRTDLAYRNNKIKTPLELSTSVLRAADIQPVNNSIPYYLDQMGMDLFNYADPTGFDEEGVAWMDTNSLLNRWNLINEVTTNRLCQAAPSLNMTALSQRYGWTTYTSILDFFEDITTHGAEPAGTRTITESWLTNDSPGTFTLNSTTLDLAVRQTLGLYLRMPEFNKQ